MSVQVGDKFEYLGTEPIARGVTWEVTEAFLGGWKLTSGASRTTACLLEDPAHWKRIPSQPTKVEPAVGQVWRFKDGIGYDGETRSITEIYGDLYRCLESPRGTGSLSWMTARATLISSPPSTEAPMGHFGVVGTPVQAVKCTCGGCDITGAGTTFCEQMAERRAREKRPISAATIAKVHGEREAYIAKEMEAKNAAFHERHLAAIKAAMTTDYRPLTAVQGPGWSKRYPR